MCHLLLTWLPIIAICLRRPTDDIYYHSQLLKMYIFLLGINNSVITLHVRWTLSLQWSLPFASDSHMGATPGHCGLKGPRKWSFSINYSCCKSQKSTNETNSSDYLKTWHSDIDGLCVHGSGSLAIPCDILKCKWPEKCFAKSWIYWFRRLNKEFKILTSNLGDYAELTGPLSACESW